MSYEFLTIEFELVFIIGFMIYFIFRFTKLEREIKKARIELEASYKFFALETFKHLKSLMDASRDEKQEDEEFEE